MDDFFSEMKPTLDEIESETKNRMQASSSQHSGFLTDNFRSLFAEALIPINPTRWPAFLAGSAAQNAPSIPVR